MPSVFERLYPEMAAGGYDRDDQVVQFFFRLHALLKSEMTIVDFGAGRGLVADHPPSYLRDLKILRGRVAKVIGVDVDPAVLSNETVDQAFVIDGDGSIPLPNESVDLVFSCATFEHLDDPRLSAQELHRILKPGGWVCAWTVNKWGYVAIVARLIPNAFHAKFVRVAEGRGAREEKDVFPTRYKLNTIRSLNKYFDEKKWLNCSYYVPGHPSYNAGSLFIARALNFYNKLVPSFLQKNLHVFMQKK